jgi:hypothetical protein
MSTVERVLIGIAIVVAISAIIRLRGGSFSQIVIMLCIATVVGIIWGISSIMAASPNPPAWTQYPSVEGALSGVAFVLLFVVLRFWRR